MSICFSFVNQSENSINQCQPIRSEYYLGTAQQDLGSSVPESDHLMRVHSHWDSECSGQTKVRDLDASVLVDQQVLRLHVAMKNSSLVTEQDALQQLNTDN